MNIARVGNWLSAKVGDELVMMSVESGNYVGVTEVGARIWELIERPMAFDVLCAALEQEFEVDPVICRGEVESFLQDLAAQGAVVLEPAPAV